MRATVGVLIRVLCGVMVLQGCAKGAEQMPGAATKGKPGLVAGSAQMAGTRAPSPLLVECLAESIDREKDRLDREVQQSQVGSAVKIPAAETVYWVLGPGGDYSDSIGILCSGVTRRIQLSKASQSMSNFQAEQVVRKVIGDLDKSARAETMSNPYGLLSAVVKQRRNSSSVYQPSPKDDFEKTVDYQARIAREKAEFDKANSGKAVTSSDIAVVWLGLFGTPSIGIDDITSTSNLYNPDTETLKLTVISHGGNEHNRPIEIPVLIKLSPEKAKTFFHAFGNFITELRPIVVMQWHNGTLTVKEVSFKDDYHRLDDTGISLDHIPMNYELSRSVLPGV
jgi:hypothetical protein